MKIKKVDFTTVFRGLLYVLIGFALIIWPEEITPSLPYVLGGLLLLSGTLDLVHYFLIRGYKTNVASDFSLAVVKIALGAVFIANSGLALTLIALVWGIVALVEGCECIHRAFINSREQKPWIMLVVEAIIQFTLGILLLIEFEGGLADHILLLGAYLIIVGIFSVCGVVITKRKSDTLPREKSHTRKFLEYKMLKRKKEKQDSAKITDAVNDAVDSSPTEDTTDKGAKNSKAPDNPIFDDLSSGKHAQNLPVKKNLRRTVNDADTKQVPATLPSPAKTEGMHQDKVNEKEPRKHKKGKDAESEQSALPHTAANNAYSKRKETAQHTLMHPGKKLVIETPTESKKSKSPQK